MNVHTQSLISDPSFTFPHSITPFRSGSIFPFVSKEGSFCRGIGKPMVRIDSVKQKEKTEYEDLTSL